MLVMKFGGSSVKDAEAIGRLVAIVKGNLTKQPAVVVSALAGTTDRLLGIARASSDGRRYEAWKGVKELQELHFREAEACVHGSALEALDVSLRNKFRLLHLSSLALSEEGKELDAEFTDGILSLGEQMSSEIVTAALLSRGVPAKWFDVRRLIVTDEHFGHATPSYYESYARLRRALMPAMRDQVPVLGGFIAGTRDGRTTTLGRGGSDFSASLVGAALNVEEIQIWSDVDGMLTCDPRVSRHAYRLKNISYREAAEMAQAGAKVLHPQTVEPAVRLRIPIVIRNSYHSQCEGTRVSVSESKVDVKSIACKSNLELLELSPLSIGETTKLCAQLRSTIAERNLAVEYLSCDGEVIYLAIKKDDNNNMMLDTPGCTMIRLRSNVAVLTLIGDVHGSDASLRDRCKKRLKGEEFQFLPAQGDCSISLLVPHHRVKSMTEMLHREFFSNVDSHVFAAWSPQPVLTHAGTQAEQDHMLHRLPLLAKKLLPSY